MESRAKMLGHAIHPILVMLPLGSLLISVLFDTLRLITGDKKWAAISFWNILAGCVSGWIAMIPGAVDWWHLPQGSRAKRVATIHATVADIGVNLFFVSWLLRRKNPSEPSTAALALSAAGAAMLGLTGWLGGELVERLGVAVTPEAHLNAPSSLTHPDLSERKKLTAE